MLAKIVVATAIAVGFFAGSARAEEPSCYVNKADATFILQDAPMMDGYVRDSIIIKTPAFTKKFGGVSAGTGIPGVVYVDPKDDNSGFYLGSVNPNDGNDLTLESPQLAKKYDLKSPYFIPVKCQ